MQVTRTCGARLGSWITNGKPQPHSLALSPSIEQLLHRTLHELKPLDERKLGGCGGHVL